MTDLMHPSADQLQTPPREPSTDAVNKDADHGHEDTLLPTSRLFGVDFPVPLYTAVFSLLGLLTLVELVIAEVLPEGPLGIAVLIALSVFKACLVVWYYMHLRTENKLYALALILPFFLGLLATFFLIAVPMTGYGY